VTSDFPTSTVELWAGPIDYVDSGGDGQPMRPGADLSIDGIALLVAEFLERLDRQDVTLIMNDWGGPQLLVDHDRTERISRLVLVACEAFDNFPPGVPGRRLAKLAATQAASGCRACCCGPPRYAVSWLARWSSIRRRMRCCATGSSHSSGIGRCGKICAATASVFRSIPGGTGRLG
jgi:pimeloyl-ACP methyl ester carboxylesterase